MTDAEHHILHVFPAFLPGGSQMRCVQLMGMLGSTVRHSVLAMDGRYGCVDHVPEGISATTLDRPPKGSFWQMGRWMATQIETHEPDLVMTYNWGTIEMLLGARRLGFCNVIHHEDGFGPEEADRYLRRRIWIRRWLLRGVAALAVPSRLLSDLAIGTWKQPRERVHYLPNGVDLDRFTPGPTRQDHASSDGKPVVIGTVGHLRPEKNQALLLTAFSFCEHKSSAVLRLVGDGEQAAALRSKAQELGIVDAVEFVGDVADTAPVYRDMDIFTLSSDTEQMPLTVLEAMASGLPVVATDVGDIGAMIDACNRPYLAPKHDAIALAQQLDRLIVDAELRAALGRANRSTCEARFSRDACYSAWVDLYRSFLIPVTAAQPS